MGIAFIVTWEHGPAFDLIMAARKPFFALTHSCFRTLKFLCLVPVSGVIIFGSQMVRRLEYSRFTSLLTFLQDLISVWMFWKPRRVESRPPSPGLDSFKEKFMLKV